MEAPEITAHRAVVASVRITRRVKKRDAAADLKDIGRDFSSTTVKTYITYRGLLIVTGQEIAYISALGAGASELVIRMSGWFDRCRAALRRRSEQECSRRLSG